MIQELCILAVVIINLVEKEEKKVIIFLNMLMVQVGQPGKRAWINYNVKIKNFKEFKKENKIKNIFIIKQQQKYWTNILQQVYGDYDDKIGAWN